MGKRSRKSRQRNAGPPHGGAAVSLPAGELIPELLRQANAAYQKGDVMTAAKLCKQALAHDVRHADALCLTGAVLLKGGQAQQAVEMLRAAIRSDSSKAYYYVTLASALGAIGQHKEAVAAAEEAIRRDPENPYLYNDYSIYLSYIKRLDLAIEALKKAVTLKPDYTIAYQNLITYLLDIDRREEAIPYYKTLLKLDPDSPTRVNFAVAAPRILPLSEELPGVSERISANIDALIASGITYENPMPLAGRPPFYLAYHGTDMKALMGKFADMYLKLCPSLNYTAPHCREGAKARQGEKPRIGFLSNYLYDHPVGRCVNGIIAALLEREEFELVILTGDTKLDAMYQQLVGQGARHVAMPKDLFLARDAIAQQKLDVLIYPDIGMNNFTYFLSFMRLAPAQAVLTGHPHTSGVPNVDYFVSIRDMEPENGAEHYTETLLLLDEPPSIFTPPEVPDAYASREELGLPEDERLYYCPLSIQKLHPEFDRALGEILRRDPKARVLLQQDAQFQQATFTLMQRMKQSCPDVEGRIGYMPWVPPKIFPHLIHAMDVVLDSFHFGGGTTLYYLAAVGTPFVAWASPFMRGRVAAWALERLGAPELIAPTQEAYVDLALRVAQDEAFRASMKATLLANQQRLYQNDAVAEQCARLFSDIASGDVEAWKKGAR